VDGGSSINIMPKSMMHDLGITVKELLKSRMIIQKGQHTIGMIRVELIIGNLSMSSIFHVINIKTSYKFLLGQSRLQENGIVAFTLH